jgi:ABC-type transport system substrate-binding protein
VDQVFIPQARANDREYRSERPGFELSRYPANANIDSMQRFHTSQVPVASNSFTGTNKARYSSPEVDALLDRYFGTIPRSERGQVLAQIVRQTTSDVVPIPLFHDGRTALISNQVQNVASRRSISSTEGWNAEQWTIR